MYLRLGELSGPCKGDDGNTPELSLALFAELSGNAIPIEVFRFDSVASSQGLKQAVAQIEALAEKTASAYGFSRTVGPRLIHPALPPPVVLYVHAILFAGWLAFFIVQSVPVRTRNVKVHRQLGWFGLALGVAMLFVGIATAITMTRLHIREGDTDAAAFSMAVTSLFSCG